MAKKRRMTQQQERKRSDTSKGLVTARQRKTGSVANVPFVGGSSKRKRSK